MLPFVDELVQRFAFRGHALVIFAFRAGRDTVGGVGNGYNLVVPYHGAVVGRGGGHEVDRLRLRGQRQVAVELYVIAPVLDVDGTGLVYICTVEQFLERDVGVRPVALPRPDEGVLRQRELPYDAAVAPAPFPYVGGRHAAGQDVLGQAVRRVGLLQPAGVDAFRVRRVDFLLQVADLVLCSLQAAVYGILELGGQVVAGALLLDLEHGERLGVIVFRRRDLGTGVAVVERAGKERHQLVEVVEQAPVDQRIQVPVDQQPKAPVVALDKFKVAVHQRRAHLEELLYVGDPELDREPGVADRLLEGPEVGNRLRDKVHHVQRGRAAALPFQRAPYLLVQPGIGVEELGEERGALPQPVAPERRLAFAENGAVQHVEQFLLVLFHQVDDRPHGRVNGIGDGGHERGDKSVDPFQDALRRRRQPLDRGPYRDERAVKVSTY